MFKDSIISALGAYLALEVVPWYGLRDVGDKIALFVGIYIILIIFCLFCEEIAEKWRNYRKRVRSIRKYVRKIREGSNAK